MNWADTVMKDVTPFALLQNQQELDGLLREQAEITWDIASKAGIRKAQGRLHSPEVMKIAEEALQEAEQKGIREVVEWVRSLGMEPPKSQLKKWGIE